MNVRNQTGRSRWASIMTCPAPFFLDSTIHPPAALTRGVDRVRRGQALVRTDRGYADTTNRAIKSRENKGGRFRFLRHVDPEVK
jgi:hypothetical protein